MTRELTKLAPHVEQARTTLAQTAEHERALVQALSAEMQRFDQTILQGIRALAAEHETRRAGILGELQALAMSIGSFQGTREAPASIPQYTGDPRPLAEAGGSYHDERALRGEQSRDTH
jgi:hypothetical protein